MDFKRRNLRALAEMVIGDNPIFPYRSSSRITEFFEECDLAFTHDGSTRWAWTAQKLNELLQEPSMAANTLSPRFTHVLRVLMKEFDQNEHQRPLEELNVPLRREGYEAFFGDDEHLYVRHIGTQTLSDPVSPHRPFTPAEQAQRNILSLYLEECSEDELIETILLPLFRSLGFHRISAAGHRDKALEYGKDVWMKFTLPTQHVLYFGLQAKRDKLDSAGISRQGNSNVAEIYNQVLMMLGHEIFDPETSRKVLVDHAFIVSGGEITKAARNWLGGKLDASKRSQILFLDRADILNLFVAARLQVPSSGSWL